MGRARIGASALLLGLCLAYLGAGAWGSLRSGLWNALTQSGPYDAAGMLGTLILLAAAAWALARLGAEELWQDRRATAAFWGAVLLGLGWLLVWRTGSALIDGQRVWWLEDDAMISMVYARNWVEGQGLVWTAGQKVEGFTNPLWVAVLALPHLAGWSDRLASLPVHLLTLGLGACLVTSTAALTRRLGAPAWAAFVAAGLIATNDDVVGMATTGMESIAVALACSESLRLGLPLAGEAERRAPWGAALWAIVLAALRSDGTLYAVGILLAAWWAQGRPPLRAWLAPLAAFVVTVLLQLLARRLYYGAWSPNTALLRLAGWDSSLRMAAGWDYAKYFLWYFSPLLALGAALSGRDARSAMALLAWILGAIAYVIWAGGDYFYYLRFFVPVLPALIALGCAGLADLQRPALRWALLGLVVLVTPSALTGLQGSLSPLELPIGRERVQLGLWLRAHAQPGQLLATAPAGELIYFSRLRGIDLLGKSDAVIAASPAHPEAGMVGHNKYDPARSLAARPDYVFGDFLPVRRGLPAAEATYDRALIADPSFQRACLPNPVAVAGGRAIFACRWPTKK